MSTHKNAHLAPLGRERLVELGGGQTQRLSHVLRSLPAKGEMGYPLQDCRTRGLEGSFVAVKRLYQPMANGEQIEGPR
jgi:hypothetical protein